MSGGTVFTIFERLCQVLQQRHDLSSEFGSLSEPTVKRAWYRPRLESADIAGPNPKLPIMVKDLRMVDPMNGDIPEAAEIPERLEEFDALPGRCGDRRRLSIATHYRWQL